MQERIDTGVFLERRSYRRRRLLDGLKLLPVLAAWVFMLPLLWPDDSAHTQTPHPMSSALTFIFAAWIVMIVAGGALVVGLRRLTPKGDDPARRDAGP